MLWMNPECTVLGTLQSDTVTEIWKDDPHFWTQLLSGRGIWQLGPSFGIRIVWHMDWSLYLKSKSVTSPINKEHAIQIDSFLWWCLFLWKCQQQLQPYWFSQCSNVWFTKKITLISKLYLNLPTWQIKSDSSKWPHYGLSHHQGVITDFTL